MSGSESPLIQWLYARRRLGWRLRLDNLRRALADLGHPQRTLPVVHIGGTNGKGSTSALIQSALTEAGYRTGLFLSPHLISFRERIRIDRRLLGVTELNDLLAELQPHIEARGLTFFESATLLALVYFARRSVDAAVFEVGMGGRLDATNLLHPMVTVITNVGHDHMNVLGSDLEKIAAEKLGILKENVPLVIGKSGSADLLERMALQRGAAVYRVDRVVNAVCRSAGTSGLLFDLQTPSGRHEGMTTRMTGRHQLDNAATAWLALDLLEESGLTVPQEARRRGFAGAFLPGRFQLVGSRPKILLDGAHNPQALAELRRSLESMLNWNRLILLFGVLRDKPLERMLSEIDGLADLALLTSPAVDRALSLEDLETAVKASGWEYVTAADPHKAVGLALDRAEGEDLIVVTGSLFLVGQVMTSNRFRNHIYLDTSSKTGLL
jgi:dihydrofolate synthase/folylpolyglutamate synthase